MNPITIHKIKEHMEFLGKIPATEWCKNSYCHVAPNGRVTHCALGHLGVRKYNSLSAKARELCELLLPVTRQTLGWDWDDERHLIRAVAKINDHGQQFGDHPKERVMGALKKRLEMEMSDVKTDQAGVESYQSE